MPVVEIENLSFAYDKQTILENINLTVESKDFLAIIGQMVGGNLRYLNSYLVSTTTKRVVLKSLVMRQNRASLK